MTEFTKAIRIEADIFPPKICPSCTFGNHRDDWEHVGHGKWKCLCCGTIAEVETVPDNDFIKKLEHFLDLNEQVEGALDTVNELIRPVVKRWHKATCREKSGELEWDKWDLFVDENEIYLSFHWEISWRYGGYDSGSFEIPFKYFYDSAELKKLEISEKNKRKKEIKDKEKNEKKRKLREYNKLKKEFEKVKQ